MAHPYRKETADERILCLPRTNSPRLGHHVGKTKRTLSELWLNGVCGLCVERRPRQHALVGQMPELNRAAAWQGKGASSIWCSGLFDNTSTTL